MIRRLLALVVLLCGVALAGTAGFTYLYERPEALPEGANIVVVSAGLTNGALSAQSTERTAAGIALYQALVAEGQAPLLVMSGGRGASDPAAHATLMGDAARAAGVPVTALRIEAESHSTLQNALFTKALLGEAATGPLILVTHRYHLPRALASFRWAGMADVTGVAAGAPDAPPIIDGLILEAVKWPANAVRAAAYSAATAAGMEPAPLQRFLR